MGATGAMMALSGANTVGQFAAQRQEAGAVLASGAYHRRIYEWNSRLAEMDGEAARRRGELAAGRHRADTQRLIGTQRAELAAQGIDIDQGSAGDIQQEAATMGELDAITIQNNAALEAWGFETQAADFKNRGMMASVAAKNQAEALRAGSYGTLLTGGAQIYDLYRRRNTGTKGATVPKGERVRSDSNGRSTT